MRDRFFSKIDRFGNFNQSKTTQANAWVIGKFVCVLDVLLEGLLDSGQGFFVNAEKKLFSGRSRENFVEENSQAVIWNRFEAEWRLAHFTDAFAESRDVFGAIVRVQTK